MCKLTQMLSCRYPRLLLPIAPDTKDSALYRDAVLRGKEISAESFGSAEDTLTVEETPAGPVEIWYLKQRQDFVRAVQALVYQCRPEPVPDSVGAQYIGGLANWEKIRRHKAAWLAAGGNDWSQELRHFTADKENYTDSLILLSSGWYSGVSPEAAGLSEREWTAASLVIRKYHELTHFIYRRAFPGDIDVVRDEVLADCMGLIAAFQTYDPALARHLLGVRGKELYPDARLAHYLSGVSLADAIGKANFWIDIFAELMKMIDAKDALKIDSVSVT